MRYSLAILPQRSFILTGSETEYAASGALSELAKGNKEKTVKTLEELAESHKGQNNGVVRVLGVTTLATMGKSEETLQRFRRHQRNLEAVALGFQIYLQPSRSDLAVKEVQAARR
ncbi:hypothetical protein CONLIGDRAFT_414592 [Coniochaeta ligniaria NRRL 30616]|uniref:Uncharacterized protein n=1 Tax=Coniochaeta ligniaria NRRL 30616 TaxID=1408157 RepID=A0A1J7I444_9PEZI|nr:hypothetical protein CONLIGDRAFT_414592 [Coniochaeta ligniaria NRRL 30616]